MEELAKRDVDNIMNNLSLSTLRGNLKSLDHITNRFEDLFEYVTIDEYEDFLEKFECIEERIKYYLKIKEEKCLTELKNSKGSDLNAKV